MLFPRKAFVFGLLFQVAIFGSVHSRTLAKSTEENIVGAELSKINQKRNIFDDLGHKIEDVALKIKEEAVGTAKKTLCSACVASVGMVQYLMTHTKWFPAIVRKVCDVFFKSSTSFLCKSGVTVGRLYSYVVSPRITCGLTPVCPMFGKRDLNGFPLSHPKTKTPDLDRYGIQISKFNFTEKDSKSSLSDFFEEVDLFISNF
ncbi:hypothetical protein FO519_002326 [Halicephalobus sp. NKZ332]|nr:hypothetical protein FO519_002326 [Halicephalobus sp. NKZ332]